MPKSQITVEEFKNFYLKMPKGQRSIRKLHTELKQNLKQNLYLAYQQYSDTVRVRIGCNYVMRLTTNQVPLLWIR